MAKICAVVNFEITKEKLLSLSNKLITYLEFLCQILIFAQNFEHRKHKKENRSFESYLVRTAQFQISAQIKPMLNLKDIHLQVFSPK